MSEEVLGLGQREVELEASFDFSEEEKELILTSVKDLFVEILKVSGTQSINSLLGELSQNASIGLKASAKSGNVDAQPEDSKLSSSETAET